MLNAKYFRATFENVAPPADPRVRIELHLHSGTVFEIETVHAIEEGYVVLQAYPPEDADAAAKRARGEPPAKGGGGATDRVVVPYESISCVHFAPAVRHAGRAAGF